MDQATDPRIGIVCGCRRIEIAVDIDDIEDEPAVLAALGRSVSDTDPLTARLVYRFEPRTDLDQDDVDAKRYDWGIYGGDGEERIGNDLRRVIAHVHLDALRDVDSDLANWRRSPLRALIEGNYSGTRTFGARAAV